MTSRRKFLAMTTGIITTGTAGCLGFFSSDEEPPALRIDVEEIGLQDRLQPITCAGDLEDKFDFLFADEQRVSFEGTITAPSLCYRPRLEFEGEDGQPVTITITTEEVEEQQPCGQCIGAIRFVGEVEFVEPPETITVILDGQEETIEIENARD